MLAEALATGFGEEVREAAWERSGENAAAVQTSEGGRSDEFPREKQDLASANGSLPDASAVGCWYWSTMMVWAKTPGSGNGSDRKPSGLCRVYLL